MFINLTPIKVTKYILISDVHFYLLVLYFYRGFCTYSRLKLIFATFENTFKKYSLKLV